MSRAERFHLQLVGLLFTLASSSVGVLWAITSIVALVLDSIRSGLENLESYLRDEFEKVHARVHAAPAEVRE